MDNMTQSDLDAMINDFKLEVEERIGGKKLSLAMMTDKSLLQDLSQYELCLQPHIVSLGLTAPTLSELFGVGITITEK